MSFPVLTPGNGGGRTEKPESENVWQFPWLIPQPPPPPEPEPEESTLTQSPYLDFGNPPPPPVSTPTIPTLGPFPTIPLGLHVPPPAMTQPPQPETTGPRQDATAQNTESPRPDIAQDIGGSPHLDASGLVTAPPVVGEIPDIYGIKLGHTAEDHEFPIHPVDMEYHLAAQHNALLNEIQLMCQHEGIPSVLQSHPDLVLSLCAEHGIDEENDAEARDYLEHWTQKLLGSDFRHQSMYNPMFLANDLWKVAHATHTTWKDDEAKEGEETSYNSSFEDYREQVEATYGVQFTFDDGVTDWDLVNVRMVHIELENVARIFGERLRTMTGLIVDDATAFRLIFGTITLNRSAEATDPATGPIAQVNGHTITIYTKKGHGRNYHLQPYLFLHELGHVFNAHAGQGNPWGPGTITGAIAKNPAMQSRAGMGWSNPDILLGDDLIATDFTEDLRPLMPLHEYMSSEGDDRLEADDPLFTTTGLDPMDVQPLQHSRDYDNNEIAADSYLNWIVHLTTGGKFGFSPDAVGQDRLDFMNENIDKWIRNAIYYNARRDDPHAERFLREREILLPVAGSGVVDTWDDEGAIVRSGPSLSAEEVDFLKEGSAVTLLARTQDVDDPKYYWNAVEDSGVYWIRFDLVNENWDRDIPILSNEQASGTFNPERSYEDTANWFREFVSFLLARR